MQTATRISVRSSKLIAVSKNFCPRVTARASGPSNHRLVQVARSASNFPHNYLYWSVDNGRQQLHSLNACLHTSTGRFQKQASTADAAKNESTTSSGTSGYGDAQKVIPTADIVDSKDKTKAQAAAAKSATSPASSTANDATTAAAVGDKKPELVVERLTGEDAGIVVLGLNRPSRKNAIGANLIDIVEKLMAELAKDKAVRVLILRSHVDGIFCAGADLKERQAMKEQDVGPYVQRQRQAVRAIYGLPFPTIAALDGGAFGGGFEIALACDIRIASEAAQMGLLETRLAIIPGAGGTQYLRKLVNPSIAKELMYTARVLSAKEAFSLGIVNHFVGGEQQSTAYDKALELARQILRNGPIAVRNVKMAVDKGSEAATIDDALQVEEMCYDNVIGTKDRTEGLTAFVEKRTPKFTGA